MTEDYAIKLPRSLLTLYIQDETIYSDSTAHIHKQNNQTKKSNDLIYYCSLPVLFGVLEVLLVMSRFQKIALDDADDADARS